MAEMKIVVGDTEPEAGWSRIFSLDTEPALSMHSGGQREFFARAGNRLTDLAAERDLPFEIVMDFLETGHNHPGSRVHLDIEDEGGNGNV